MVTHLHGGRPLVPSRRRLSSRRGCFGFWSCLGQPLCYRHCQRFNLHPTTLPFMSPQSHTVRELYVSCTCPIAVGVSCCFVGNTEIETFSASFEGADELRFYFVVQLLKGAIAMKHACLTQARSGRYLPGGARLVSKRDTPTVCRPPRALSKTAQLRKCRYMQSFLLLTVNMSAVRKSKAGEVP